MKFYVDNLSYTPDKGLEMMLSFKTMTDEQEFDSYLKTRGYTQLQNGSSLVLTGLNVTNDEDYIDYLSEYDKACEFNLTFLEDFSINTETYSDNRMIKCELTHKGESFDIKDILLIEDEDLYVDLDIDGKDYIF